MQRKELIKRMTGIVLAGVVLCGCGAGSEQYIKQAEQYLEQEAYGQALEQYNKAIMEDEKLQEAYRGAGIASMKLGDYENAEDMFLRALKETNGIIGDIELDLSYYLGECQLCLEQYKEAKETYSNIISYDEDETEAYFYRGYANQKAGDAKAAQKDLEKAAKTEDLTQLYGIYEVYAEAGNDKAQEYLKKIVQSKDDSAKALLTIGRAYEQLGDTDRALECLQKSAKAGETAAGFYIGQLYQAQGDYTAAVEAYQSYQKSAGLSYGEYRTVEDCMLAMGDYTAALELNQKLQESAGKTELRNLLFDEVVLYEKSCDYENAKVKIQEYCEQYPEDEEGQKEYEFLQTR